jgi:tRNA/rRNA methyltransferase
VRCVFVLVEPEDARNVGATARALNTMGHDTLRLVRPRCDHLTGKAKALAHRSFHLLESAEVFDSLKEATADCSLRCAATARHRKEKLHYLSIEQLPDYLRQRSELLDSIAMVFGGETSGLSNADLDLCELVSTIPQAKSNPSLNLSQAVMLYSFTLSFPNAEPHTRDERLEAMQASTEHYTALQDSVSTLLEQIDAPAKLKRDTSRALARLDCNDLFLVHRLRKAFEHYMKTATMDRE